MHSPHANLRRFPPVAILALASCARSAHAVRQPAHVPKRATPAPIVAAVAAPEVLEAAPPEPAAPLLELPRGGRTLFPHYRLMGYCGTPGAPDLGALQGNLSTRAKELVKLSASYAGDREVLPTFELISVIVMGAPGVDKAWRRRVPASVVDEYLRVARETKALLLLNIQPGHSDFLTEVKAFERWLREPDVGIALDPEWAMWKPDQKPGSVYGQTTGEVINDVGSYLSQLVAENGLPEKALVFHQVNGWVLKDEAAITSHPGVVLIKSVDGLGITGAKIGTYHYLVDHMAPDVHPGFKLFFDEDVRFGGRLMGPKEVMSLSPVPEYVMYE
jgi:hypothetical protein